MKMLFKNVKLNIGTDDIIITNYIMSLLLSNCLLLNKYETLDLSWLLGYSNIGSCC